jgi:hypothetical protein
MSDKTREREIKQSINEFILDFAAMCSLSGTYAQV